MRFWVGFAVGAGVGAGGTYFYLTRIKSPSERKETAYPPPDIKDPASVIRYHDALKHGAPVSEYLRFYTNFAVSFDSRTRNPKWVIERLTKETVQGTAERGGRDFFEDQGIDPRFRSKLADYKHSGYDRGHLAAAANHKNSQAAMDETFTLNNISPQVGEGFNRDYWARFEKFVKDVTKKSDEVYVITGPLWLPRQDNQGKWWMNFPLIGQPPALVSVPTHFYKVVLAEVKTDTDKVKAAVGAFVMPNDKIENGYPLEAFIVPLEHLESAAGMKFFPAYLHGKRQEVLDKTAQGLQQVARRAIYTSESPKLLPPVLGSTEPENMLIPMFEAPRTPAGLGVTHLCEHVACRLPAEKFWERPNVH